MFGCSLFDRGSESVLQTHGGNLWLCPATHVAWGLPYGIRAVVFFTAARVVPLTVLMWAWQSASIAGALCKAVGFTGEGWWSEHRSLRQLTYSIFTLQKSSQLSWHQRYKRRGKSGSLMMCKAVWHRYQGVLHSLHVYIFPDCSLPRDLVTTQRNPCLSYLASRISFSLMPETCGAVFLLINWNKEHNPLPKQGPAYTHPTQAN